MRHCFEKKSFMSHISGKNGIPCDILAQKKVKNEEMSHDTIQNHNGALNYRVGERKSSLNYRVGTRSRK